MFSAGLEELSVKQRRNDRGDDRTSRVRCHLIDSAAFLGTLHLGAEGAIILASRTKILCYLKLQLSHPLPPRRI